MWGFLYSCCFTLFCNFLAKIITQGLLKHYRRAITKSEAEAYYNICPDTV